MIISRTMLCIGEGKHFVVLFCWRRRHSNLLEWSESNLMRLFEFVINVNKAVKSLLSCTNQWNGFLHWKMFTNSVEMEKSKSLKKLTAHSKLKTNRTYLRALPAHLTNVILLQWRLPEIMKSLFFERSTTTDWICEKLKLNWRRNCKVGLQINWVER